MTSKTLYSFGGVAPVASHAFNGKGDQIAISKNNKDVEVVSDSTCESLNGTTFQSLLLRPSRSTPSDWGASATARPCWTSMTCA